MANEDDPDDTIDEKFIKQWNVLFHKASAEREKRFKTSLLKDLDSSLTTKFDELTTKLVPVKEEAKVEAGKVEGAAGGSKLSAEHEAIIRQAQIDAKAAKDMAEKWKKEAEGERERGQRAEERQQLTTMLQGKVRPSMLDVAVDRLHSKNILRDKESGAVLWKGDDGEMVPLKDGIDSWAKSELGKEFAPPRDVRGNGSRGPEAGAAPGVDKSGVMTMDGLGALLEGTMGRSH